MTFLGAAKRYLELGFRPVPCRERDKRALVRWRDFQQRTPTLAEVEHWWTQWPHANVGLVMGNGIVALDLDGPGALDLLHREGIVLPDAAPRVKTGKGEHVYFSAGESMQNKVAVLVEHGSQVDFRADGGYVLAPPSIHPSGAQYEWTVKPVFPLPAVPERLALLLARSPRVTVEHEPVRGPGWVVELLGGVPEGRRDDACTRLAGYFVTAGLPSDVALAILSTFGERCQPPFPVVDVRKTLESVARLHAAKNGGGQKVRGEESAVVVEHVSQVLESTLHIVRSGEQPRVRTGFTELDRYLGGGYAPGELVYLGGRPGSGKTAFALQIATAAARSGTTTLVVSREMVVSSLARRLIAQEGPCSAMAIRTGRQLDWPTVTSAAERLASMPLWLTDSAISLADIRLAVESIPEGLGFLIVDYLQLVRAPWGQKERRLQVEAVSQGLKELAVGTGMPVLCLSSLSRPPQGQEKKPTLASLRDSGELEHDADVVLLLHREMGADHAECVIAKNRDGQTGTATFLFRGEYVRFAEEVHAEDYRDVESERYP